MKSKIERTALVLTLVGAFLAITTAAQSDGAQPPAGGTTVLRPAMRVAHASQAAMLAVAHAGTRLVAVGDHGVVLLSDDSGVTWRQADHVPFDGLLTDVHFPSEHEGWAVGHAGVVLHTQDAGVSWKVQRSDVANDRPLFGVHFFDGRQGVAVGLWGLVLVTSDAGTTWKEVRIAPPKGTKSTDVNLWGLFADAEGRLYAPAERGLVLRSADRGQTWSHLNTGYTGSLWTGVAIGDHTLAVGGLRGSLYVSGDSGTTWRRIDTRVKASITSMASTKDGEIVAVGLDGVVIRSSRGLTAFDVVVRADRIGLTAVATSDGGARLTMMSRRGTVAP